MRLTEVNIFNYRSIKQQKLTFKDISGKKCCILVGSNEGGKSNILRGINGINEDINYSIDCNKDAKKENDAISIEYVFSYNEKTFKDELLKKELINEDFYKLIKISKISQIVSVEEGEDKGIFFDISVEDKAGFNKFVYNKTSKIIDNIEDIYEGTEPLNKDNISLLLPGYSIVTKTSLESLLENHIDSIMFVPKIIFWKSSDKYLINEPIDLKLFKEKHNLSIPLRNIFYIAEINNIKERIDLIQQDNEARDELAEELSEKITNYINEIWPEHKIKLEIKIEESLNCRVNVIDNDSPRKKYSMDQRSDGFKQFISILLNLSVENKKEKLKNYVILLDEPEVHLHPSGIKYLRDELLKISSNNIVVLSTHSIYMIDKTALNRHHKIDKVLGETIITPIEDNPYKEEVIYESLGTSIYEHIKPNMILVEGKTDKDIFDAFTKLFEQEISPLDIGVISSDGVSKIENYAKFFDGKSVKGFVLVDSDKPGKGQKEKVKQIENYSDKNVFEINDIKDLKMESTLEDLLPLNIVIEQTNLLFQTDITENSIDKNKPVLEQIKKHLKGLQKIGNKEELIELKGNITNFVLSDLKTETKDVIKKKYKKYLDFVIKFHTKLK